MRKKILIVVLLLVVATALFVSMLGTKKPTVEDTGAVQPDLPIGSTVNDGIDGKTLQIQTSTGAVLDVRDFLNADDTVSDPQNYGHYFVGGHYPFDQNAGQIAPPYIIEYFSETEYFNIVLLSEPLFQARVRAQSYLMETLGITESEMCSLEYTVSVPNFVNEYYSGQDMRFSFCPDAIPLD